MEEASEISCLGIQTNYNNGNDHHNNLFTEFTMNWL